MSADSARRAVTPLFRVFGNKERRVPADARVLAVHGDMHPGEHAVFAALVPLTLAAAIAGPLGWWLAVPLAFLALTTLPLLLPLKRRGAQWSAWLGGGIWWAIVHRGAGGFPGTLATFWIGLAVLNLAAVAVLTWKEMMAVSGNPGIWLRAALILALHAGAVFLGWKCGWIWLLPAAVLIGMVFCTAVLRPSSQILGDVFLTVPPPDILVTIDDGPDPQDTPVLLGILDRYNVKAIFFMIGEKVLAQPELAQEVVRRGHEIGNHTHSHPQATFWCAGPWRTRREISRCQMAVRETTGVSPRLFRAPVGHRNLFTHPIARALGMEVMAWNRRGYDAVETDPGKVLSRILPRLAKGDIVLLHEATPIAAGVLEAVLAKRAEILSLEAARQEL